MLSHCFSGYIVTWQFAPVYIYNAIKRSLYSRVCNLFVSEPWHCWWLRLGYVAFVSDCWANQFGSVMLDLVLNLTWKSLSMTGFWFCFFWKMLALYTYFQVRVQFGLHRLAVMPIYCVSLFVHLFTYTGCSCFLFFLLFFLFFLFFSCSDTDDALVLTICVLINHTFKYKTNQTQILVKKDSTFIVCWKI